LKRRSTENQAPPGTTLNPAPEPVWPPTTSIESLRSSSCDSSASGDAMRIMCSNALTPSCT
jgi:hypothetical protein